MESQIHWEYEVKTESQIKYHCQLCQEETDHNTAQCPKLKCLQCGLYGHAKRDCPSNSNLDNVNKSSSDLSLSSEESETVKKSSPITITITNDSTCSSPSTSSSRKAGTIIRYDPQTCRGLLKDFGKLLTFNEKGGEHVKGDHVTYDLINGIVYNVTKIKAKRQVKEDKITKKPKKLKKDKKVKKTKKKECVTKCLCILDIQTISIHGQDPQISQIGAIILNDENEVATFNRSVISPEMTEMPDELLHECNVDIRQAISESSVLNQFVNALDSHTKNCPISLLVLDAETVITTLIRRLEIYDLWPNLSWKCDLKTILKSKLELKHLHSFCWGNFFHVYEHVCQEEFRLSKRNMSAKKSVGLLWYVTEKIFGGQDLQHSDEFNELFTKLKSLKKSQAEKPSLPFPTNLVYYQNCVYEKSFKYSSK